MINNRKLVKSDTRYFELKTKNSVIIFVNLIIPVFLFFVLQPILLRINNYYFQILYSIIISAISYVQFVAILHGLSHNHFFQSRKRTYIFGKIISSFVFMDFDNYRKQHLDHHASVEKNDRKEFFDWKNRSVLSIICNNLFLLYILKSVENRNLNSIKSTSSYFITFFMHILVVIYFHQFSNSFVTASVYVYGFLGVGNTLRVIRSSCEHCIINDKLITNSFKNSLIDKIFFCPFSMNYHHEHHLFPNIPENKLKTVNSIINIKLRKSLIDYLFFYSKKK